MEIRKSFPNLIAVKFICKRRLFYDLMLTKLKVLQICSLFVTFTKMWSSIWQCVVTTPLCCSPYLYLCSTLFQECVGGGL